MAGAQDVGAHKTSMLLDVEHDLARELDAVMGAIVELGCITGVPTSNREPMHGAEQHSLPPVFIRRSADLSGAIARDS
jgi:hypothetical protein